MSFRTHLTVAGFGLAGIYLAVGLFELVAVGDLQTALVFALSAAVTAGLIAIVLPILAPRGDQDDDEDGGGPGGGGETPKPPPWWPEFEREFWSHVERARRGGGRPRDRVPA